MTVVKEAASAAKVNGANSAQKSGGFSKASRVMRMSLNLKILKRIRRVNLLRLKRLFQKKTSVKPLKRKRNLLKKE